MKITITLMMLLGAVPALAAGFDCAKAQGRIEQAICNIRSLSRMDEQINEHYQQLMQYQSADGKKQLRAAQLAWLKQRNSTCTAELVIEPCLQDLYQVRLDQLKQQGDFWHKDMAKQAPALLSYLKSTQQFDLGGELPNYYPLNAQEFLLAIDWAQGGNMQLGIYRVNPAQQKLDRLISGYPNAEGIYQDEVNGVDRRVLLLRNNSERQGLGWQSISALEIYRGKAQIYQIAGFSYYALDGEFADACYDTETKNSHGRLEQAGKLNKIAIADLNGDGFRDVAVEVQTTDCTTGKSTAEQKTFLSAVN